MQCQIAGTEEDWRRYMDEMLRNHSPRLRSAVVYKLERLGHNLEYV